MKNRARFRSALCRCVSRVRVATSALAFASLGISARPATMQAQLRPLDPLEWMLFDTEESTRIELGVGVLDGQRASLAGVRGRLWELGLVRVSWRTGRLLVEASGTVRRAFQDDVSLDDPVGGVEARTDNIRWDTGDWEVTTAVRLTPVDARVDAVLRFGTRLPTTDNSVGLERDQTDFFALVGGRWNAGAWSASAESGLGIHGTRDPAFEQSDLWLYDLALEYQYGWFTSRLALLGQKDGLDGWAPRGTEELNELRLDIRAGRKQWIEVSLVRGLAEFSPAAGLSVSAGMLLPLGDAGEGGDRDR